MRNSSEPMNEQTSTTTSPATNGFQKQKTRLVLRGSLSGSKKVALKRLPRRDASLLRFLKGTGIKPSQVETAPNLTSFFPNRKSVIDAIRFSQEPSAISFLRVYDSAPERDRKQISLEAIALKAQCNFTELLGAMMFSFKASQVQKSAMRALDAHPDVVSATILDAMVPGAVQAKKMLHEAVGFLQTPKGASINFNFGHPEEEKQDNMAEATSLEVNELFPMITERQEKWQHDRSKMLESGS